MPTLSTWNRAILLGVASGSRSTLGITAPLRLGGRRALLVLHGLAVAGELVGDKLPTTPSRLAGPGPALRAVAGAVGGGTVAVAARRAGADLHAGHVAFAGVLGAAGSLVGTYGGAAWRRLVAERDLPDWPAALLEDAAALTLTGVATRDVR